MTDTYTIAEVARRSGFPASTLRYYEDVGLVPAAGRTDAGYRVYDDRSLAKLAFVARAKQLGCTLDEIADLVTAWEGERCEPVQDRLRGLVESKIADTQTRLGEMVAFTAQLHEAAAALRAHPGRAVRRRLRLHDNRLAAARRDGRAAHRPTYLRW